MSTREQAILYWILILFFLIVIFGRKNNTLDSLKDVFKYTVKFLLNPIAVVIIVINLSYLMIMYYFVYKDNLPISLWYIKDYLFVLFFSVLPIIAYLKKLNFRELIHEKKTELFSLAAIPLFINSTYTLPVIWEMVLVFILTLLSVFIAITNQKEDTQTVAKFFHFFVISIGLFMLVTSLYQFIKNMNDVFSLDFWLSFGIELLVWILNIPIIYLARKMIYIGKKVTLSDYKNRLYAYNKYSIQIFLKKIEFRKYRATNCDIQCYIKEARKTSAIGGSRVYITLNKETLSEDILIALISDAILGRNKYTDIKNQRDKYPSRVEVSNENNELYAYWQDAFVSPEYRDTRIDEMKTIELIEGIKLIQK